MVFKILTLKCKIAAPARPIKRLKAMPCHPKSRHYIRPVKGAVLDVVTDVDIAAYSKEGEQPCHVDPAVLTVLLVLRLGLSAFTADVFLSHAGVKRTVPFSVSFAMSQNIK